MNRVNRLSFLPFLLQRWKGWKWSEIVRRRSYSIAVLTHAKQVKDAVERIKSLHLPSRVRIIVYIPQKNSKEKNDYPVNKLRNIAIVNIITTHFLVMDMDMWPARTFLLSISSSKSVWGVARASHRFTDDAEGGSDRSRVFHREAICAEQMRRHHELCRTVWGLWWIVM